MKLYEKAIEVYEKRRRDYHDRMCRDEVQVFRSKVQHFAMTGDCSFMNCSDCPLKYSEDLDGIRCNKLTDEDIKRIAREEYQKTR